MNLQNAPAATPVQTGTAHIVRAKGGPIAPSPTSKGAGPTSIAGILKAAKKRFGSGDSEGVAWIMNNASSFAVRTCCDIYTSKSKSEAKIPTAVADSPDEIATDPSEEIAADSEENAISPKEIAASPKEITADPPEEIAADQSEETAVDLPEEIATPEEKNTERKISVTKARPMSPMTPTTPTDMSDNMSDAGSDAPSEAASEISGISAISLSSGKSKTSRSSTGSRVKPEMVVHIWSGGRGAIVTRSTDESSAFVFESSCESETKDDPAILSQIDKSAFTARIIFSCDREAVGRAAAPIYFESNGLIIDVRSWSALAVPPKMFTSHFDKKKVDGFLKQGLLDVIKIEDGTVATLYCWNHPVEGKVWSLGTSNGYDVSGLRWMGRKTYAEVVYEIMCLYPEFMKATGPSLTRGINGPRLAFTNLDPRRSYTFGFRHHDFHPLLNDPQKMWFIQSCELAQYPADSIKFIDPLFEGIARRENNLGSISNTTVGTLESECDCLDKVLENNRFDYGYILRFRGPAGNSQPDFLIESSLLKKVKRLIYERIPHVAQKKVNHTNRVKFIVARAFLGDERNAAIFQRLFPQFDNQFAKFQKFLDNVVDIIVGLFVDEKKPGEKSGEKKPGEKSGEKKPGEKSGEKKPGEKKPGEKKPGEKKPGEKKQQKTPATIFAKAIFTKLKEVNPGVDFTQGDKRAQIVQRVRRLEYIQAFAAST